MNEYLA